MSDELERLRAAVRLAEKNLEDYLKSIYPEGLRVGVRLNRGQKSPTWGVVHRVWGSDIQVHFEGARKQYRHIDPSDVMETGDKA